MQQDNRPTKQPIRINWPITIGVSAVLLFLFSPLLAVILYGGAGGAIGGTLILLPFIVIQWLVYRRLRRWLPNVTLGKPDEPSS